MRFAPKVFVSRTSAPASTYARCTSRTRSGERRFSSSYDWLMNTPFAYSCVPMAPSKTTTWSGSSRRASFASLDNGRLRLARGRVRGAAHGVVLGFGMMHDDRGRGLLGQELERLGQIHSERFGRGQQLEHGRVVVEIGA